MHTRKASEEEILVRQVVRQGIFSSAVSNEADWIVNLFAIANAIDDYSEYGSVIISRFDGTSLGGTPRRGRYKIVIPNPANQLTIAGLVLQDRLIDH